MDLSTNQLFTMALQLGKEWQVVCSKLGGDPMTLEIQLDFKVGSKFPDPETGVLCPVHDTKEIAWRHLNFWQYTTLLRARVPRIITPEGKVRLIDVPWARPGSGFTLLFEAMIMLMVQQMPVSQVAEILGESDTRLWRIICHHVEIAQQCRDWSGVRFLQVDETSSRKGHRYVTTILDAETHQLLFIVEGKSANSLKVFAEELLKHGGTPEQIELISMDMSPAFRAGATEFFPEALVVFDHFHIAQLAGKAFDEVRKQMPRGSRHGGLHVGVARQRVDSHQGAVKNSEHTMQADPKTRTCYVPQGRAANSPQLGRCFRTQILVLAGQDEPASSI